MDSELATGVVALLTAALSLWQEFRHRKEKKAAKVSLGEAAGEGPFKTKPVPRRRK